MTNKFHSRKEEIPERGNIEYGSPHTKDTKHPHLPKDTSVNQHSTQLQSNVLSMGHVNPGLFLTAERMTAVNLRGKEICVCILSHQSLGHTILCYAFVVCMLSYLAYLDNAQQSVFPPTLYSYKHGAKYWSDKYSLCSLLFHCFMEGYTIHS